MPWAKMALVRKTGISRYSLRFAQESGCIVEADYTEPGQRDQEFSVLVRNGSGYQQAENLLHAPVVITRKRDQAVVMLSLEDYEALEETAYLLRSPANARRLLEAIESLARGKGRERRIHLAA